MKNKQTDHIPDISKMVSTEDVSTEFVEIVNKNFWEMIDMENKQTERIADGGKTISSIDWLEDEMKYLLEKYRYFEVSEEEFVTIQNQLFNDAKEKHKQEIINAVEWNYKSNMGEVYYLATYKNQNNDN